MCYAWILYRRVARAILYDFHIDIYIYFTARHSLLYLLVNVLHHIKLVSVRYNITNNKINSAIRIIKYPKQLNLIQFLNHLFHKIPKIIYCFH